MTNPILVDALAPIVSRVVTSHCWVKRDGKMSHIARPLTSERLTHHVNGGPAYGAAQIEPGGSTTRVACLDLDSHKGETAWPAMQAAALAIMSALEAHGLAPIPFRSSGGAGLHLYLLWSEPQAARDVRAALHGALQSCGYRPGVKGLAAGEVEVFPKQDSVPADGFGNMFVLPLAGASVPLDTFELDDMPKDYAASMDWPVSRSVPVTEREPVTPPALSDVPVELEQLRTALDAIPNAGDDELDYDAWRDVIFGIHHATRGSDDGLALAHTFSAKSTKYDPAFLDARVWPHIGKTSDAARAPVTARTILKLAREYGWQEPIADEFDVVPAEEQERGNSFREDLERAEETPKPDLIKGVMPDADFGIIYGASGAGKSFAAIDLGFHLALGRAWRGRKVKQRSVFYVAAEGAHGVRRRTRAWRRHHGIDARLPFYTREKAINLHVKNAWVKAAEDINELGGHGVIIIDTLSRSIPGVEENSAKDMSQVVENCSALGRATGCMVVVIAHAGKEADKGVRGSSALRAAADFELSVTRHLETPWRCIKLTKAKDDVDGTEFGFTLTSIEVGIDEDGETVYSAVAVPSDERPTPAVEVPRSAEKRAVLSAYEQLCDFENDGLVPVEDVIKKALEIHPIGHKNAHSRMSRYVTGERKPENFYVINGRVGVTQSPKRTLGDIG